MIARRRELAVHPPPPPPTDYPGAVMASGPLAYYRLQETGTDAGLLDATGNHPGTWVGSPSVGWFGPLTTPGSKSMTFFSSTAYGSMPVGLSVPVGASNSLSVTLWYKPPAEPATSDVVVLGQNPATTPPFVAAQLPGTDLGFASVLFGDESGNRSNVSWNAGWDNNWIHFAMVLNGSGTKLVYVNASLIDTSAWTLWTDTLLGGFIGYWPGDHAPHAAGGFLSEVAIFNRALSGAEISAHYALT